MEEQRKIVKYQTVAAKNLGALDAAVQDALRFGYQPYGNPVLDIGGRMVQALVQYAPWTVETALKKFKHDSPTSQKVVDPADDRKGRGPGDGVLDDKDATPATESQESASRLPLSEGVQEAPK